jgi:hypothetical protein
VTAVRLICIRCSAACETAAVLQRWTEGEFTVRSIVVFLSFTVSVGTRYSQWLGHPVQIVLDTNA